MLWLTARLHRRFLCSRSADSATRLPDRGELSPGRTLGYVGLSEQLPLDWCCGVQHWPLSTATKRHLKKTQPNKQKPKQTKQTQTKTKPKRPHYCQGVRGSGKPAWNFSGGLSQNKKKKIFLFLWRTYTIFMWKMKLLISGW